MTSSMVFIAVGVLWSKIRRRITNDADLSREVENMNGLPKDPYMLLSVVNMKLRDFYDSLDALCDDMDADKGEIMTCLERLGYSYSPERNAFIK